MTPPFLLIFTVLQSYKTKNYYNVSKLTIRAIRYGRTDGPTLFVKSLQKGLENEFMQEYIGI